MCLVIYLEEVSVMRGDAGLLDQPVVTHLFTSRVAKTFGTKCEKLGSSWLLFLALQLLFST